MYLESNKWTVKKKTVFCDSWVLNADGILSMLRSGLIVLGGNGVVVMFFKKVYVRLTEAVTGEIRWYLEFALKY